jgi:serine acetyltransferase
MNFIRTLSLLQADLSVYKPDWNPSRFSFSLPLLLLAFLKSRDFRLNVFVRAQQARIPVISRMSHSLIFYLYGSTIDPGSFLDAPIRFVHARNLVIGKHVRMSGQCILIFHNVTLGKLRPGESSHPGSMPIVHGPVIFGSGSTVLGGVSVSPHVVFGASSLCTLPNVESYSTLVGYNLIHSGVYYQSKFEYVLKPAF